MVKMQRRIQRSQVAAPEIWQKQRASTSSLLLINLFRLLQLRFSNFKSFALAFDGAEETGLVTLVARRADLLDLNEQHVAVAIKSDVFDRLGVTAFFAFHPEFLT